MDRVQEESKSSYLQLLRMLVFEVKFIWLKVSGQQVVNSSIQDFRWSKIQVFIMVRIEVETGGERE